MQDITKILREVDINLEDIRENAVTNAKLINAIRNYKFANSIDNSE